MRRDSQYNEVEDSAEPVDGRSRNHMYTIRSIFLTRHVAFAACVLILAACARTKPTTPAVSALEVPMAVTITRVSSYPNTELAAEGRGRLEVVVRSTDRPTELVQSSEVWLFVGVRDTVRRTSNERGMAIFESIPVGNHVLTTRRLGYGSARKDLHQAGLSH